MSGKKRKAERANDPDPTSTPLPTSGGGSDSAVQRRVRYGLNVAVAVAVAVVIVLLVNWLVYTQYRGLSPDARRWVRYDLTSTRSYTLSEQTRGVLNNLTEPHQVISMLGGLDANEARDQRVRDLIDEYARNSKLIEAEHLNLTEDQARRSQVLAELAGLFADNTESIREALAQGFEDLDAIDADQDLTQQTLSSVIDLDVLSEWRDREALSDLNARYLRLAELANDIRKSREEQLGPDWQKQLADPGQRGEDDGRDLPDYTLLLAQLQDYFVSLSQEVLPLTDQVVQTLIGRINPTGVDAPARRDRILSVKNDLVRVAQTIRPPGSTAQVRPDGIFGRVVDILRPLLQAEVPVRYDDARAIISDQPCLIIRTPTLARVIPADRLFRGTADSAVAADSGQVQEQFLGEEQLTGAFISLTLDPPPLIVFVRSNLPTPALTSMRTDPMAAADPNAPPVAGLYNHVATRLRSLGFEITQWRGAEDPPRPRANQRVVWVTMPYIRPNPRNRPSMDPTLKNKVFAHVQQRLAAGDSAMIMLSQNDFVDPKRQVSDNAVQAQTERTLANDAQINLLKDWGINAQVYQFAFVPTDENDEGQPTRSTSSFIVTQWPNESFVEVSLRGIPTFFKVAHPLVFEEAPGVKHTELARIDQPGVFVQRFQPEETGRPIRPEPGSERDSVLVAAAAERGEARLIAVGDGFWATDEATTFGRLPDGREGPGLATLPGATIAYPGNTELFVSSVFWLAHQEQLIAASPRTQDLRRIEPIEPATLTVYRGVLIAGLPGLVFVIGVAVWLVRRKA